MRSFLPLLLLFGCGAADEPALAEVKTAEDPDEVVHWTCPMHPSVQEAEQTPCAICSMKLTPVTRGELESGAVVIDALRRQRFGVDLAEVAVRPLARELRLPATVKWDDQKIEDLSIRAEVWVEEVFDDIESGTVVDKGQPLAVFYSPELYGAQREYLALRGNTQQATRLERLKLIGLSDAQIRKIARRGEAKYTIELPAPMDGVLIDFDALQGEHLMRGATFGRIAKLDTVWVEAQVPAEDVGLLTEGQTIEVQPADGTAVEAVIGRIESWVDPKTRRVTLRSTVDNPEQRLLPDMYVEVRIKAELGEKLSVPTDAVIVTGERRVVFVDAGEDRLVPRDVQVGGAAGEWTEVVSGLKAGDQVVRGGVFLVAAESRLRAAETYWGAEHGR